VRARVRARTLVHLRAGMVRMLGGSGADRLSPGRLELPGAIQRAEASSRLLTLAAVRVRWLLALTPSQPSSEMLPVVRNAPFCVVLGLEVATSTWLAAAPCGCIRLCCP
jgi:hypothetical protein